MPVLSLNLRTLLLSAIAVLTAGALGAVLGLSGAFAGPTIAGTYLPDGRGVSPADCVRGSTFLGFIPAGARVVLVYRSDDGTWVGIRTTPASDVGWLPLDVVTIDDGEPDLSTLPVGGACPEVTFETPTPDPGPDPDPTPGPTPDTTAPMIGQPSMTPDPIACEAGDVYPTAATIQVSASDNQGVSRVEISWTGVVSGSGLMTPGSPWTFVFDPPGGYQGGPVTFRLQAFDAAGNASARPSFVTEVQCFG
jgi:hypothetical protein